MMLAFYREIEAGVNGVLFIMIVTKFKALSAEVCSGRYVIERDSKTPGKVDLICKESGIRMALPAHADQVADFVKAYIYLTQEDIGYRTVDVP